MHSYIRYLFYALGLVLLLGTMLPFTSSSPVDHSEERKGRTIGSFFGFCNANGKMCGTSSNNGKDCCGNLVCLLVPDQIGYYCMRDPTMPELYNDWFTSW